MNTSSTIRILIIDPQPVACEGMTALFSREADMLVVGAAQTSQEALDLYCALEPNVVVMEIDLPDRQGIEFIATLTRRYPAACILVVSRLEGEETIYRALEAGARGYYFKSSEGKALAEALRLVCSGHRAMTAHVSSALAQRLQREALSAREIEVLALVATGCSNGEIGAKLFIAEGTVKAHLNSIYHKLQVSDRTQAVVAGIQRGIVSL